MAVILPPRGGIGQTLGSALGTGLGEALKGLSAGQQNKDKFSSFIQGGIAPQDAQLLSLFNNQPEVQAKLLGELFQRGGGQFNQQQASSGEAQGGIPQAEGEGLQQQAGTQPGQSAFYQPSLQERRRQEEFNLKKEKNEISRDQAILNTPLYKETEKKAMGAEEILPLIDNIQEALKKVKSLGLVGGQIPAFSGDAQLLDSLVAQLVIKKTAFETLGSRATDSLRELEKMSKVSRSMNRYAIERRLDILREEANVPINKRNLIDNVISKTSNVSPSQFGPLVRNVEKVSNSLDPAENYTEGTVVERGGYLFEEKDGKWSFIGRSRG